MEFDTGSFLASMVVSGIGFVAFAYGKKQKRFPQMLAGLIMLVYPYFVPNVFLMFGIAALILVAMFAAIRFGA
jgi:hypothetical protein